MRAALVLVLLAGGLALAAGVTLTPSVRAEFANCPADGGSAQTDGGTFHTLQRGVYLLRVTGEDTNLCWANTCAPSAGERFPQGTVMMLSLEAQQNLSCWSATATGDAILTRAP